MSISILAPRIIQVYNVLERTLKVLLSLHMDNKPVKGEYLDVLLRSAKTIFSTKMLLCCGVRRKNKRLVGD